jgi:hypothetical protein
VFVAAMNRFSRRAAGRACHSDRIAQRWKSAAIGVALRDVIRASVEGLTSVPQILTKLRDPLTLHSSSRRLYAASRKAVAMCINTQPRAPATSGCALARATFGRGKK